MKKIKINYVVILCVFLILGASITFGWKDNKEVLVKSNSSTLELKNITKKIIDFGPRNCDNYENLNFTKYYIKCYLENLGYKVKFQNFKSDKNEVSNIIACKNDSSTNKEKLIIGAHYDSGKYSSANGSATPIASLLQLAKSFKGNSNYDVEFVAFFNKEIPYMSAEELGSDYYVENLKNNKTKIKGALILDSLGLFNNKILSQRYPFIGINMPTRANFIAVNGNKTSKNLLDNFSNIFEQNSKIKVIKSEKITLGRKTSGIKSFWDNGYPALLISDTGILRSLNIYNKDDNINKVNFNYMSDVNFSLSKTLKDL